jgi:hypothetical protein
MKDAKWAFTTHTYDPNGSGNRGENRDIQWGIDVFLKHMLGVQDRFINAFRHYDYNGNTTYIDHTSGGVRLANWAGGVSSKHVDDMSLLDPDSLLTGVTNGAVPEEMAVVFREEFKKLFPDGDYERPTPEQVAQTKIKCKERLNAMDIRTANGDTVKVDTDKPLIAYERRLVKVKAGRNRAFTDDNIWALVQMGFNVLLMGNNQGTPESEELAVGLRDLEIRILVEKAKDPQRFPGKFFFVEAFTPKQKKACLAAKELGVKDSDNHSGAAEVSEEDGSANGAYEAGGTFREGVITDQGIRLNQRFVDGQWVFDQPGEGNVLIPMEDTSDSWRQTVYEPFMRLWQKSVDHREFYMGSARSVRVNRIQRYLITSAAYLRQYDKVLGMDKLAMQEDQEALTQIVASLKGNKEQLGEVLAIGRNGVTQPFGFYVARKDLGTREFVAATSKGLIGFASTKRMLEEKYGYDALLGHFRNGNFENYLNNLFHGLPAEASLQAWFRALKDARGMNVEKNLRLGRFVERLAQALSSQAHLKTDQAQNGGIDLKNINVERQGEIMPDVITDKAIEGMLMQASGIRGVIMSITPIADIKVLLH